MWLAVVAGIAVVWRGARRARRRVGSAASGAVYDLLNEDRRKAIEIIVEQRAEVRDPEYADAERVDTFAAGEPSLRPARMPAPFRL